ICFCHVAELGATAHATGIVSKFRRRERSTELQQRAMDNGTLSRRSLLQAIAATMASAALPFGWAEIAQAVDDGHVEAVQGSGSTISLLTAAEAADIEAIASAILRGRDS